MASEIISLEDCERVVKQYLKTDKFQIVKVQTKQFFEEVNGFLGEHLLLLIEVIVQAKNEQLQFFMKRFPFQHVMQSEFLRSMQGWQKEIYFYETFLKNLKTTLPNYDSDFVPQYLLGKADDIIVFEDLTLKNYSMPRKPSLNLLDNEHICLVLEALAKLHAGSLAYEEYKSEEIGRKYRLFDSEEEFAKEPLLRKENGFLGYDFSKASIKGLSALIDKIYNSEKATIKEIQMKFDKLVENALQLLFFQNEFRNVLAHGDLWAKNVMYQYDDDSSIPLNVLLVDFQLFRYNVPAHDILLFIFLTTNQELRKNYFHYYLNHYYITLVSELKKVNIDAALIGMSHDDFLRSVSHIMPEIKIQGPLQRLQQCGNKEFYNNLLNDKEAFKRFIFHDKTPFALELFETDANFRLLLTEAVEEIIEAALYPDVFREDCYRFLENDLGDTDYKIVTYEVFEKCASEYLFELDVTISRGSEQSVLRYLVESKPSDFAKVVQKL